MKGNDKKTKSVTGYFKNMSASYSKWRPNVPYSYWPYTNGIFQNHCMNLVEVSYESL
jgi:hypothetical protein